MRTTPLALRFENGLKVVCPWRVLSGQSRKQWLRWFQSTRAL